MSLKIVWRLEVTVQMTLSAEERFRCVQRRQETLGRQMLNSGWQVRAAKRRCRRVMTSDTRWKLLSRYSGTMSCRQRYTGISGKFTLVAILRYFAPQGRLNWLTDYREIWHNGGDLWTDDPICSAKFHIDGSIFGFLANTKNLEFAKFVAPQKRLSCSISV